MSLDVASPIVAIVYADGEACEAYLKAQTAAMAAGGLRLAGLIQHSAGKQNRRKCDMQLRDLSSGEIHQISDDRGPLASGCVLNTDRLLRACEGAKLGLSGDTDLLVLSKFGKSEAEGGGYRSLIAAAMELSVPVVIGVPAINLAAFRAFAGSFACEWELPALEAGGLGLQRHLTAASADAA